MQVLIISFSTFPASPSGPAYIAGAALDDARKAGQLDQDQELFDGAYYMSPELPKDYMIELIESLRTREDCTVQVNKPYVAYK